MDFDDFDDEHEDDSYGSFLGDHDASANDLDPFNLSDPVSSFLYLSDDVQKELENPLNRKLKCLLCGHEFFGRKTDHCPICYGTVFSERR